jgi:hypothetical protein
MAKKKSLLQRTEEKIEEEIREAAKLTKNAVASVTHCGHINKQSYNADNELEDVVCTREKGHAGDHTAEVDGKEIAWNDAAGRPVKS